MTQPPPQISRIAAPEQAAEKVASGNARLVAAADAAADAAAGLPEGLARLDPRTDLWDATRGDLLAPAAFAARCRTLGLVPGRTEVFFADAGDGRAASAACWAFAVLGHARAFVVDGGFAAWQAPPTGQPAARPGGEAVLENHPLPERNDAPRATRHDVADHLAAGRPLLDARSPAEFAGVLTNAPEKPQEGIRQSGHLPGALSVPWDRVRRAAGASFARRDALRACYQREHGLRPGDDLIVYSRTAPRACHTWAALTSVLGFRRVRVYDGGWAEWGNLVGAPIAR